MPLSSTETAALIARAQTGSSAAEDALIRANEGLVYSIARKYAGKARGLLDVEDLAQHGRIGLLVAIRKYDPSRGCALSTVAHLWIRQAIARAIDGADFVRVPAHALAAGVEPAVVLSIDFASLGEDGEGTLADLLPAPDDTAAAAIANVWTEEALSRLEPRSRAAVELHVLQERTLEEVGAVAGLTREGTRMLVRRGLRKLERSAAVVG